MFAYNRELENRDLMNPENGLLPESTAHKVSLEANPFQKYIGGRDVVQDYQLPNMDNERKLLASIAARMDPAQMLDASNIDPDRVDEDIMEQMIFEDTGNTNENYMGLDATDFVREQQEANQTSVQFATILSQAPGTAMDRLGEANRTPSGLSQTTTTATDSMPAEFMDYLKRKRRYAAGFGSPTAGFVSQNTSAGSRRPTAEPQPPSDILQVGKKIKRRYLRDEL